VPIQTGSGEDADKRPVLPLLPDGNSSVFEGRGCRHDFAPVKDDERTRPVNKDERPGEKDGRP